LRSNEAGEGMAAMRLVLGGAPFRPLALFRLLLAPFLRRNLRMLLHRSCGRGKRRLLRRPRGKRRPPRVHMSSILRLANWRRVSPGIGRCGSLSAAFMAVLSAARRSALLRFFATLFSLPAILLAAFSALAATIVAQRVLQSCMFCFHPRAPAHSLAGRPNALRLGCRAHSLGFRV